MSRQSRARWLVVATGVLALELACRLGLVSAFTMPPPSTIVFELLSLVLKGALTKPTLATMRNVALAFAAAFIVGGSLGVLIHRWRSLRRGLDPLFAAYFAIPIFAFYPLFIILFGLNALPQIIVGFLGAFVYVIVNTLNGLDRVPSVLLKTARIHRLGVGQTAWRVTMPSAMPHILTGAKLGLTYAFTGVIGTEFILSETGLGLEISTSYNSFNNKVMYPAILLVLLIATAINSLFFLWEGTLRARRRA